MLMTIESMVRPPLRSAQALAASPNRLKLIHQLAQHSTLMLANKAWSQRGVNHQTREQREAGQVMDILTKLLWVYLHRCGRFSPRANVNRAWISLRAEQWGRLSRATGGWFCALQSICWLVGTPLIATDPQYDGRYIEYDYSKLLKDKPIEKEPIQGIWTDVTAKCHPCQRKRLSAIGFDCWKIKSKVWAIALVNALP